MNVKNTIQILGTRGIPAAHGGFETLAQELSLYLAKKNWNVVVYCQEDSSCFFINKSSWSDVDLIKIGLPFSGSLGSVFFDLVSMIIAAFKRQPILLLGYNTACFAIIARMFLVPVIINMDGIEWKRQKWGFFAKSWFWVNEIFGLFLSSFMIADHPHIRKHLERFYKFKKISTIAYGADEVLISDVDSSLLSKWDLRINDYALLIARIEPENKILDLVRAYVLANRSYKFVIVGPVDSKNPYHQEVLKASNGGVVFAGAQFDKQVTKTLRYFSKFYCHGHSVGGTNPSLVEALGASCAVLAHDNPYNRGVAGPGALYFTSVEECAKAMDKLEDLILVNELKIHSKRIHKDRYEWKTILDEYEDLLLKFY